MSQTDGGQLIDLTRQPLTGANMFEKVIWRIMLVLCSYVLYLRVDRAEWAMASFAFVCVLICLCEMYKGRAND